MCAKIYEHAGIKLSFKTTEEETESKKLSPGDIIAMIIFSSLIGILGTVAFSQYFGWWATLIWPALFMFGAIIRVAASTGADPYSHPEYKGGLTEGLKRMLKKDFAKTFYTYRDIAITEHYIVSPYSEKLNTISISCIKPSDIVWFYEYDCPTSRGHVYRTSVFYSNDKQAITLTDGTAQWNGVIRALKSNKGSRNYKAFRDMILKKIDRKILVGQSVENERAYYEIIGEEYEEPVNNYVGETQSDEPLEDDDGMDYF